MSDNKIPLRDTFDFSKDIENLSLSSTYILGLEQLMLYFITTLDSSIDVKAMFEKFQNYISGELKLEDSPFNTDEANLYTIFSLQQLLKAHAYKQGLEVKVEATVDESLVKELLEATTAGDMEKVNEINQRMVDHVNSQLS